MKKFLLFGLLLLSATGCSKDDELSKALVGTSWISFSPVYPPGSGKSSLAVLYFISPTRFTVHAMIVEGGDVTFAEPFYTCSYVYSPPNIMLNFDGSTSSKFTMEPGNLVMNSQPNENGIVYTYKRLPYFYSPQISPGEILQMIEP